MKKNSTENRPVIPVVNEPIHPDGDTFAHLMYGCSYEDFDEEFDDPEDAEDAEKKVGKAMQKFAKQMTKPLAKIGVTITNVNEVGCLEISGVTKVNFWDYLDALSKAPFPGELYMDDLSCFLPIVDEDALGEDLEDVLYPYVKDWCWF